MTRFCSQACLIALAVLLVGCGPTRTAGTRGLSKDEMAVLKVEQHNAVPGFHVNRVTIDGEAFEINKTREFYLTPGSHKLAVGYGPCVHGPHAWFSPMGDWAMFTPRGQTTGDLAAGSTYKLRGWTEGSARSVYHEIVNADWEPPVGD